MHAFHFSVKIRLRLLSNILKRYLLLKTLVTVVLAKAFPVLPRYATIFHLSSGLWYCCASC